MKIAIIGLGYVGMPLATVFADAGVDVVGVEAVAERCDLVNAGESYIEDVPGDELKRVVDAGGLRATTDYDEVADCDAIVIACRRRSTPTASPTSRS